MKMPRVALALVVIGGIGCGSPNAAPNPGPSPTEMIRVPAGANTESRVSVVASNVSTVKADIAAVWRVMPAVFDSLRIPVTSIDPAARSLGNGDLKLRRRLDTVPLRDYLNCGTTQGAPNADTYDIRLFVLTQLTSGSPGTTTVTTTVQASGRPISTSGDYLRCSSTGALELRLGQLVASRVQSLR